MTQPPMIFAEAPPPADAHRRRLRAAYREDETAAVERILAAAELPAAMLDRIAERARDLVHKVRQSRLGQGGLDAFLHEYELSSREGVVLMCLAEALLRIPDAETANLLIKDKLADADWRRHLGSSESLFVNASTWALMLTGRVIRMDQQGEDLAGVLRRLVARSGEPVIRQAVTQAMRILGRQFVMGRTIEEALDRARAQEKRGYRYSYDMLGESARTARDAERYDRAYRAAIAAIGRASAGRGPIEGPGISVKLSALHPRYEFAQRHRVMAELVPRLAALARLAKAADIGFTIDAEEADRLDLSLDVIEAVSADPSLAGWNGLGLAIQGYQKRVLPLIDCLGEIAHRHGRRLHGPAGQGRLLGQRDQAEPGARAGGLSGLHPQGLDRRLLHRGGQAAARRCRSLLSAIRHPQRPYPGGGAGDGGQPPRFRVPAPAWHGRGALRSCRRTRCQRLSLPHLCALRQP